MFCFCRILRHVSAIKSINRTRLYLQPYSSNYVHTQNSSKEYHENILQEKGPYSELFQDIKFSAIIWRKQQPKVLQEFLKECFKRSDGSPLYAINLIRLACDKSSPCSPDLVSSLIVEFGRYLVDHDIEFVPSEDEKLSAINCVLMSGHFQLLPMVFNVFQISGKEDKVKSLVDELVQHQKLIEAAYFIGALNLHEEYEIEEIIIPLLLNGKINPVYVCLLDKRDLQIEVAKKLDSKLGIRNTSSIQSEYFRDSKKSKKVLESYIKHFKVPPKECKNLYYIRGRNAINHLTKRLSQQLIAPCRWEEMVMSVLIANPDLKNHLEYKLEQIYDKDEALKMMERFEMKDFDIASNSTFAKTEEDLNLDELEDFENDKSEIEAEENHLTLPLEDTAIKFIDTEDRFNDFLSDVTKNYNILGIDSEWKPHFGLSKDRVSLIQLAVHDKVYILDALSLSECLSIEHWDKLNENVFGNPKIIKLGCDMITDIQMIVNNNKGTTGKKIRFSHILDIVILYDRLQKTYPELTNGEPEDDKKSIGLSKLCETILGKPLNKEERLCDWEKRPLSESQLGYAALDAYCLLQIYDKLKDLSVEYNMNFELQERNCMVLTAAQCKPKKGKNMVKTENRLQRRGKISIQDFKVAVDPEMKHQGDHLEKLGADVLMLSKSQSPEEVSKIVNNEGRMLICSEEMFEKVENQISPFSCFKSPMNVLDSYITTSNILQRFNVFIPTSTPHCKICYSKEAFRLSPEHINLLQNPDANEIESGTLKEGDNFHEVISNMRKSGVSLKFSNQKDSSRTETLLCLKCGTIQ